jgi:TolB protein
VEGASPDDRKIAFTSVRDGNQKIYVMDADGADPNRLTADPARDSGSDWQPVVE